MKLLHKIKSIEVKRAFVTAQKMRLSRKKGRKYLPKLERKEFLEKLNHAKRSTLSLTDKQLDNIIAKEYKKREVAYNSAAWYVAVASSLELGVWRRAGGLPTAWTCCDLARTAQYVQRGIEENSKRIRARSKRAIPRIGEFADIIAKEKSLFPIVFQSGTGIKGRSWCRKKVKGDIDDGCMRAIALAIKGHTRLRIYMAYPKPKS